VVGDKASRKALDSLNLEAAALEGEAQSLVGALEVARRNLAAAIASQNRAADELKARTIIEIADAFDAEVQKLGDATDALASACTAIAALHTKLYGLGAQRPSRVQLDTMLGRIVATTIMKAGLQQQAGTSFLAPGDRKSVEVLQQYADIIRFDANSRIVGENREAA
jgi:divalent metal cation (Fe/Co/Zn/Cd) transporter